ncbi:hypothetical protein A3C67_02340 [Candidatus Nomurabacteria bacterium RIFCSPHIGHO2_02_FULL_42_19]|uniref:Uncharacterized protein n=1 Tax=Candidatus Nomurabacteria bacterium RIFCSPHIGHO2_02_FULL_42_19 TaxID=1801756 RepID=A0A1F6W3U1_9BACT|nr:MAG: hypothetical protein A3C67_02340 [Candidatus Nomurabacteria bacterium RIFCSPHIGHO2_02_FULL_42_19]
MLPENIIYLGAVFYIIGYYVYVRDMFRRQTRPNLVSWFIWMLAPFSGICNTVKSDIFTKDEMKEIAKIIRAKWIKLNA